MKVINVGTDVSAASRPDPAISLVQNSDRRHFFNFLADSYHFFQFVKFARQVFLTFSGIGGRSGRGVNSLSAFYM